MLTAAIGNLTTRCTRTRLVCHGLCRRKGRASPWRAGQRTSRPALSTPCTENTFFAKSIPTVVTLVMTSPSRE